MRLKRDLEQFQSIRFISTEPYILNAFDVDGLGNFCWFSYLRIETPIIKVFPGAIILIDS